MRWVLQGSVDTLVRWGGQLSCRAMSGILVSKLLKSDNYSSTYRQQYEWMFFFETRCTCKPKNGHLRLIRGHLAANCWLRFFCQVSSRTVLPSKTTQWSTIRQCQPTSAGYLTCVETAIINKKYQNLEIILSTFMWNQAGSRYFLDSRNPAGAGLLGLDKFWI